MEHKQIQQINHQAAEINKREHKIMQIKKGIRSQTQSARYADKPKN
jgi:hypothetical protein